MEKLKPESQYKNFAGWNTDTSAAKTYLALPDTMKTYVNFINDYLGVKVQYISNGPGRDQIVQVS
jgi:adenylosuccinate synthase